MSETPSSRAIGSRIPDCNRMEGKRVKTDTMSAGAESIDACRVAFTPSIKPNSANAAVTVNQVRTASVGLRHSALQTSGAYFTPSISLRREVLLLGPRKAGVTARSKPQRFGTSGARSGTEYYE